MAGGGGGLLRAWALRFGIEALRRTPGVLEGLWGENPLIRSWRPASFDENFTEDADESGPVSKSVNTGHCLVPASKSEKVGTQGLVSSAR